MGSYGLIWARMGPARAPPERQGPARAPPERRRLPEKNICFAYIFRSKSTFFIKYVGFELINGTFRRFRERIMRERIMRLL